MAPPDDAARWSAARLLDRLTKPPGSLGRLEEVAIWAAGVQERCPPQPFARIRLTIVAGDHGIVAAANTSAYPAEVTAQMVANFLSRGAAANVLADAQAVGMSVIDASVDSDYDGLLVPESVHAERIRRSSGAIDREDALTLDEARRSVDLGHRVADREIDSGADLLIVGDMGIGNTTVASTIVAAITGAEVAVVTGRGTGIDDQTWMRKAAAIRDALWRCRGDHDDPVVLLARIGGADFGVMAAILARAAERRTPVILDGLVVTAAALIAERMSPGAAAWWLAGHRSAEPAHALALDSLSLRPLLELDMRLGEGSGALTALPLVQNSVRLIGGMATFDSAGVAAALDGPTAD